MLYKVINYVSVFEFCFWTWTKLNYVFFCSYQRALHPENPSSDTPLLEVLSLRVKFIEFFHFSPCWRACTVNIEWSHLEALTQGWQCPHFEGVASCGRRVGKVCLRPCWYSDGWSVLLPLRLRTAWTCKPSRHVQTAWSPPWRALAREVGAFYFHWRFPTFSASPSLPKKIIRRLFLFQVPPIGCHICFRMPHRLSQPNSATQF